MKVKTQSERSAPAWAMLLLVLSGCSLLDGPMGPFSGGALEEGELVKTTNVDWASIEAATEPALLELQLIEPTGSRTVGFLVHEEALYIPCDLGFVWRRIPVPPRWLMSIIYRVKGWHEDVLKDGRVVVRVGGKRYERQAILVEDQVLLEALRNIVERGASEMFGTTLGPVPDDEPNDIWFFRLDPRPDTISAAPKNVFADDFSAPPNGKSPVSHTPLAPTSKPTRAPSKMGEQFPASSAEAPQR